MQRNRRPQEAAVRRLGRKRPIPEAKLDRMPVLQLHTHA
jgi:hypothetical protein